jgi:hypothetical protein
MVASPHHVGERQQRRHERVVFADGEREQRAIGEGHAHRLGLGCTGAVAVEKAAVHARRVEPLAAEGAGAIRKRERHHREVADLDVAHLCADVLDDPDCLVAHRPPGRGRLQGGIGPKVAAADGCSGDPDDGVGRLDDRWIGNIVDTDIAGLVHQSRSHLVSRFPFRRLGSCPVQESTRSGRVRVPVGRGTGRVSQAAASGSRLCDQWTRAARLETS